MSHPTDLSVIPTDHCPGPADPPVAEASSAPRSAGEQSTTGTVRPPRLVQIDVMRLLICASVVATHVVSNANPIESVPPNGVVNLLHYTRQAFFFISALVLVRVHGGDTHQAGGLRKRISVLGVPYLLWSTVYAIIGLIVAYSWHDFVRFPWHWLTGLIQGTDGYHMYFLLVSVEFAVVFPLFLRLLRATRGHHVALLLVCGALEVGLMACYHYVYLPEGWWRAVTGESSLLAYQFWFVAGGLAAVHFNRFHRWLRTHRLLVVFAVVGMCVAATGTFLAAVAQGVAPEFAARSLQPITVPLSIAAIAAFYLMSTWLAGWRRAGRFVAAGTYLSFGIYLCHPAILTGLLAVRRQLPVAITRHAISVTIVIAVLDFILATLVAAVLARTPAAKALIGRPRR